MEGATAILRGARKIIQTGGHAQPSAYDRTIIDGILYGEYRLGAIVMAIEEVEGVVGVKCIVPGVDLVIRQCLIEPGYVPEHHFQQEEHMSPQEMHFSDACLPLGELGIRQAVQCP